MEAKDVDKIIMPLRVSPETADKFRKFQQGRGVTADRALQMLLAIWGPAEGEAK